MTPTRTIPVALVLAALIVSCTDSEPAVRKPASPDDPSAHLVEKYGPPPAGGPTGRRKTVEGIVFIELSPGYFLMGSEDEEDRNPRRWVEIPSAFAIAKTEVTNEQYERFDPGHKRWEPWRSGRHPVVHVFHSDAVRFCEWLARTETGEFRLPTEAEWEFSCRAGSAASDSPPDLDHHAWYSENAPRECPVATREPNPWGLYDMLGNVWEWAFDWQQGLPRGGSVMVGGGTPVELPSHPARGGSFACDREGVRASSRLLVFPRHWDRQVGFRPVAIFPEEK